MVRACPPLGRSSRLACLAVCILAIGARAPAQDEPGPPASGGKVAPTFLPGDTPARLDYIDTMLAEAWRKAGVKPSAVCTDAEFVRRAYLDLLGRIPTVPEAESFLANRDPGRRAKLIETLLNHPDYAKNFGLIFRNLLVGRRPQGNQVDPEALDAWLRQQFAANRPWDEVAYELITARGWNKENGAVNFTLAHMSDQAVNLTSYTTRVFLGQQIQCTQCHDHPTNDWKQADFWGINAFYRGVRSRPHERNDASGGVANDGQDVYDEATSEWAQFENRKAIVGVVPPTYLDGRRIDASPGVDRRSALARMITEPSNEQFARAFVNRIWGHLFGRGFVHPVDDFGDHNPASVPELLDQLAADFRAGGYDVKALVRWIAASKAYQLSSIPTPQNQGDEALFSHYPLKPLTPEQLFDALITATAAHRAAGESPDRARREWLRQFVVTFANDEAGEASTFQGTIPQALMMMNGDLMAKAVGGRPGSFLASVLDEARLKGRGDPMRYCVDRLYMAALSRYPTRKELERAAAFLNSNPDTLQVLQDLFWVLLNSNEFVLNH
jgi:hypothetical protein